MKKEKFPNKISIFPLSNFIFFPNTNVPLNIFEPRYIEMINDSMRSEKLIGMIQPKKTDDKKIIPELYKVGCLGKIRSFQETESGTFLIELKGIIRFSILSEIQSDKKYRLCEVDYGSFEHDLNSKSENIKFSDLELIFKDLKSLFEKKGLLKQEGNRLKYVDTKGQEHKEYRKDWTGEKLDFIIKDSAEALADTGKVETEVVETSDE